MSDTPTDWLTQLVSLCACEVSVVINAHTISYQSVEDYLGQFDDIDNGDCDAETREEMIQRNRIVEVQAYPRTPIGFYRRVHWDIGRAIQEVYESVMADRSRKVSR
jgi:hypothetical protein